ncbi:MAG: ATP-binding protein [Clostridiales bacterium]|nr:ATP-binding protein [Clostridiales bacterium]
MRTRIKTLIGELAGKHGKRVVVLIDEYDKPILDHINDAETAEANRDVLRGFFGVLKSMDPFIRLTFVTGVTKFTKVSVFSGLNNLRDITMSKGYAGICGIAIKDLDKYFGAHIERLASLGKYGGTCDIKGKIRKWYDGYSWDGESRVINPFSLLGFFSDESFESYWYASGTPAFMMSLIKKKPASFLAFQGLEISKRALDTFDVRKMNIVPLLFQTGYLTVDEKRVRGDQESYLLKMPNLEVREAFYLNILADFTDNDENFTESAYWKIKEALKAGGLQSLLEALRALFASIPYEIHIPREAYYHSVFYAVMNLLGFDVDAEVSVSGGRVDAVLELGDKAYVMEFKYEDCAPGAAPEAKEKIFDEALAKAMKQITDRGYAKKFAGGGKTVYQVAFEFLGRDDIKMAYTATEGS